MEGREEKREERLTGREMGQGEYLRTLVEIARELVTLLDLGTCLGTLGTQPTLIDTKRRD